MANPYFTATGVPAASSSALSGPIRAQFSLVEAGFNKCGAVMPGGFWKGNAGGSAMEFSSEHVYLYQSKEDATIGFYGGNGTASISYTSRKYEVCRVGRFLFLTFDLAFLLTKNTDIGVLAASFPSVFSGSPLSSTIVADGQCFFGPTPSANANQTNVRLATLGSTRGVTFSYFDWDGVGLQETIIQASDMSNTNYVIYGSIRSILGAGI